MLAIVIVTMSVIASNEGDDILLHNRQFLAVALLTENGTVLRTIMLVICDSCSSPVCMLKCLKAISQRTIPQ